MHSFGTELRGFHREGIDVSETLMPRGLQLAEHTHEAGQICFVLEGVYTEDVGGNVRMLRPGMMHVRPPGAPHANRFAGDEDALTLLISIEPARWVLNILPSPAAMLDGLAAEMRQEIRRGDEAAGAALEGLALLTMSRVARMAPDEPPWLADAASLIRHHFAEALSLRDVAQRIGVPRGALAIAFRRYRGTSVGDAIRAARVARAQALLMTSMPLAAIAEECGFHDQAHLTRVFRSAMGLTPGRYRSKSSKCVSARKSW